jgi:hypothetical protein
MDLLTSLSSSGLRKVSFRYIRRFIYLIQLKNKHESYDLLVVDSIHQLFLSLFDAYKSFGGSNTQKAKLREEARSATSDEALHRDSKLAKGDASMDVTNSISGAELNQSSSIKTKQRLTAVADNFINADTIFAQFGLLLLNLLKDNKCAGSRSTIGAIVITTVPLDSGVAAEFETVGYSIILSEVVRICISLQTIPPVLDPTGEIRLGPTRISKCRILLIEAAF